MFRWIPIYAVERMIRWGRRCRVHTRCQQLLGGVAMVMLCFYGFTFHMDRIELDPYYLHPTTAPVQIYSHAIVKNLTSLAQQFSNPAPILNTKSQTLTAFKGLKYIDIIERLASPQKQIVLALIDGGVLNVALNFYMTCLRMHRIQNYLLLSTDHGSCERLMSMGIHCHVYREDKSASEASDYLSESFLRKMNIRTSMILEALNAGYEVLHTDVDMYCSHNMLRDIHKDCPECDIVSLSDTGVHNAGFIYVKPTTGGIRVYKEMQQLVNQNTTIDDQTQLNNVIENVTKAEPGFKAVFLGEGYQSGWEYYENWERYFALDAKPCPECVVIHNNWIVSMAAKIYRAKEMHQWIVNDNQYYTSTNRKYIVYDNPLVGSTVQPSELEALKNALAIGLILNRTVILPKFHSTKGTQAPLNSLLSISALDAAFGEAYREHSFLEHPLVPWSLRSSSYGPVMAASEYLVKYAGSDLDKVPRKVNVSLPRLKSSPGSLRYSSTSYNELFPQDFNRQSRGWTDKEVLGHFRHRKESVLHFFALYNVFDRFEDPATNEAFQKRIQSGFVRRTYRQMPPVGNNTT